MRPLSRSLFAVLLAACAAAAPAAGAEPAAGPIVYAPFDANHCLTGIRPSREESAVEFHWGCAGKNLITISCVFDRTGYQGLGPGFARPGWHSNHPLPALADDDGRPRSDVAVADLGGFAVREKPFHRPACWRAMIRIKNTVNRTGRAPAAAAAESVP